MADVTLCEHLVQPLSFHFQNRSYSLKKRKQVIITSIVVGAFTFLIGGLLTFFLLSLKHKITQLKKLSERERIRQEVWEKTFTPEVSRLHQNKPLPTQSAFISLNNSAEGNPPHSSCDSLSEIVGEDEELSVEQWDKMIDSSLHSYEHRLEEFSTITKEGAYLEFEELSALTKSIAFQSSLSEIVKGDKGQDRFDNILPYKDTVVPLPDEGYINASFVLNDYIAAQGPMQSTIEDFFDMILFHEIENVVMLAGVHKNEALPAFRYWPKKIGQSLEFSHYKITLQSKEKQDILGIHLVQRTLIIENRELNTTETIKQHHVLNWPDMGIIPSRSFLKILRIIHQKIKDSAAPLLVHCIAGSGRSGTFIAGHHILKNLHEERPETINIAKTTVAMRKSRMGMIQTNKQYRLIFQAVASFLKNK